MMNTLAQFWEEKLTNHRSNQDAESWPQKKKQFHEQRGNKVVRMTGVGKTISQREINKQETEVEYVLGVSFLVKQEDHFYQEEDERLHQAVFYKGILIKDKEKPIPKEEMREQKTSNIIELTPVTEDVRFEYDRREAVRYAERWWNDVNPAYRHFENDNCTNFVSQCLRAGGAPMRGHPNRATGWWYQDDDWSFSWSVAHSMRWYLSGSTKGLRGLELESPKELLAGDVICYDFEGDGRWDHTAIVVEKDRNHMPLVNAHTNNSRHRYWDYQDSLAWTPECQYKFFRISSSML